MFNFGVKVSKKEIYTKEYLDKVKAYHTKIYRQDSPVPEKNPGIRPEIFESWKRSRKNKVNPETIAKHKVPNDEFIEILKANERLIHTAAPYIRNIYQFVKGSNFVLHLTDKNGCLLKYFADDEQIKNLFKHTSMLDVGSIRNEMISGTDSTALCLYLDKPVQVIGAEHYLEYNHAFFCSSAPIHDTDGSLIGVLTIMGPSELYQHHTLGMACATTNGIELELQRRDYYNRLTATNKLLSSTIEGLSAAIVMLNEQQEILRYNRRFIEIFALPSKDYQGTPFFTLFQKDSFPKRLQQFRESLSGISFTASTEAGTLTDVVANIKIIPADKEGSKVILLSFDEQKEINTLVNKFHNLNAIYTFDSIIGESRAITEVKNLGKNAALSNSNVLILGESGTGKELLAQSIHNASERKEQPFVTINCGSIPKNLIESELFGYESGAFTGAGQDGHPGKFELADKGALFLDEIGDMPLELQASLLRVLQSHEVVRLGGKYPKYVDVRIIAATNIDLISAVNNKTFRSDLYYRLNVLNLTLPALRDRKEDIPLLVNSFIGAYSAALKKERCTISDEALAALRGYDWPGNIRELENIIERAINIVGGTHILQKHLPGYIVRPDSSTPPHQKIQIPRFKQRRCQIVLTRLKQSSSPKKVSLRM